MNQVTRLLFSSSLMVALLAGCTSSPRSASWLFFPRPQWEPVEGVVEVDVASKFELYYERVHIADVSVKVRGHAPPAQVEGTQEGRFIRAEEGSYIFIGGITLMSPAWHLESISRPRSIMSPDGEELETSIVHFELTRGWGQDSVAGRLRATREENGLPEFDFDLETASRYMSMTPGLPISWRRHRWLDRVPLTPVDDADEHQRMTDEGRPMSPF